MLNPIHETTPITEEPMAFSDKYDQIHAQQYFEKHQDGIWRKLSNLREQQIARKALKVAGNPKSVLDMPCGTGRFWEVLAEDKDRIIYASDYNQPMIDTGMRNRPKEITSRIETFQASAFDMPLSNDYVECIFCMRLMHHLGEAEDRQKLLKELHRVAKDTVIISLWVDGNFKARRRQALEKVRKPRAYQNRFVVSQSTFEKECELSGFAIVDKIDFLKHYHMWRTYVLRKA